MCLVVRNAICRNAHFSFHVNFIRVCQNSLGLMWCDLNVLEVVVQYLVILPGGHGSLLQSHCIMSLWTIFTWILPVNVKPLWIRWLLSANLRWRLNQIPHTVFWYRNRIFLSEGDWFRLVLSHVALRQLSVLCLDGLNQGDDEADFSVDCHTGCEELFYLKGGLVVEEVSQHREHIFHESVIVLRFQVVTTVSDKVRNWLWVDE